MSESKLKAEMFVKRKERKEEIQTWDLIEVGQGRTNHSNQNYYAFSSNPYCKSHGTSSDPGPVSRAC